MKLNFTFKGYCSRGLGFIISLAILFIFPSKLSTDVLDSSSSSNVVVPTTLKVILVQFNDVKGDQFWDGSQWQTFTYRYKMSDFEDLLTSLGTYTGERNTDFEPVFGSFRDYFFENSRRSYSPTVQILNQTDVNGYPVWIELTGNKTSYSKSGFISAANSAATDAGLDISDVVPGGPVRLCYIYAGNIDPDIEVFANDLHGHTMVVPERMDKVNQFEYPAVKMTHLGYYAHEFGHLMGAHHTFTSHHHSLMHSGHKAGTRHANRPASMNPWFLYQSGWANLNFLDSNLEDVDVVYNTSPTTFSTYYIRKIPGTEECFLVENRQYDNTYDQSLPGSVEGLSGGILIWNILNDGLDIYWDAALGQWRGETELIEADNDPVEQMANMAQDMFRPDVYTTGKINDVTTPANLNLRDGSFSKFAVAKFFGTGNPINVDLIIDFVDPPKNLIIVNAGSNGQHPVLQWDANTEPDLDYYIVYRGYNDLETGQIIWNSAATTTNTTWVDNDVTINTSSQTIFRYKITAVDDASNESDYSNTVFTNGYFVPEITTELVAETNLPQPKEISLQQNYPNPFTLLDNSL